jgi:hypothetical protein
MRILNEMANTCEYSHFTPLRSNKEAFLTLSFVQNYN